MFQESQNFVCGSFVLINKISRNWQILHTPICGDTFATVSLRPGRLRLTLTFKVLTIMEARVVVELGQRLMVSDATCKSMVLVDSLFRISTDNLVTLISLESLLTF